MNHYNQMHEENSAWWMYDVKVDGGRSRGRLKKTWQNQVNPIYRSVYFKSQNIRRKYMVRHMNVNEARRLCWDRIEYRSIAVYSWQETPRYLVSYASKITFLQHSFFHCQFPASLPYIRICFSTPLWTASIAPLKIFY